MKALKKIINIFSVIVAAAVFASCSNVIEDLKKKTESSTEEFIFQVDPDSDINVTVSNKILTADEGYTDYVWYVNGVLQAGKTTNVFDMTSVAKVSGSYNITVEAKKDGKVYSASVNVKVVVPFTCSSCGTEYSSKAEKEACDKEYGCPSFNVAENIDKLYFYMSGFFWKFDIPNEKILNIWVRTSDTEMTDIWKKIYTPDASHAAELDALLNGQKITAFEKDSEGYNSLVNIMNYSDTVTYDISYVEFAQVYSKYNDITADIKKAFGDKENPVLPESIKNDDVFYIYKNSVTIMDLTKLKMYYVKNEDMESTENQIPEDSSPEDITIVSNDALPDTSKATKISSDDEYRIVPLNDGYYLMKIDENPQNGVDGPIYMTDEGEYYQIYSVYMG